MLFATRSVHSDDGHDFSELAAMRHMARMARSLNAWALANVPCDADAELARTNAICDAYERIMDA